MISDDAIALDLFRKGVIKLYNVTVEFDFSINNETVVLVTQRKKTLNGELLLDYNESWKILRAELQNFCGYYYTALSL